MRLRTVLIITMVILGVAYMLGVRGLLDDGQAAYSNVSPACLELHRLSYCQEKGKNWDKYTIDKSACETVSDARGNKWLECEISK